VNAIIDDMLISSNLIRTVLTVHFKAEVTTFTVCISIAVRERGYNSRKQTLLIDVSLFYLSTVKHRNFAQRRNYATTGWKMSYPVPFCS